MPKVLTLLRDADLTKVSRFTGISVHTLENLSERKPILGDILRKLYRYFDLEIDDFYIKNVENHPRRKRHEGIIWEVFRRHRVELGLTIDAVARILRVSDSTIDRLERSVQLPGAKSYTVRKLFLLYEIWDDEQVVIAEAIDSVRRLYQFKKKRQKKIKTP